MKRDCQPNCKPNYSTCYAVWKKLNAVTNSQMHHQASCSSAAISIDTYVTNGTPKHLPTQFSTNRPVYKSCHKNTGWKNNRGGVRQNLEECRTLPTRQKMILRRKTAIHLRQAELARWHHFIHRRKLCVGVCLFMCVLTRKLKEFGFPAIVGDVYYSASKRDCQPNCKPNYSVSSAV